MSNTNWESLFTGLNSSEMSLVYRKWVKRGRNANNHGNVHEIQNSTNKLIREAKRS